MLNNIPRLIRTLRYLKIEQIFYQIYYRLISRPTYQNSKAIGFESSIDFPLVYHTARYKKVTMAGDSVTFSFLNKDKRYDKSSIDWNDAGYGKLWTYHLNYFEFLADCDFEDGKQLITSYTEAAMSLKDGMEPFPTSLRIVNWIKFAIKYDYRDEKFLHFIQSDINRLEHRLEYHLLANHLLENFCALWVAAYFFDDKRLKKKVSARLVKQLNEQFNQDGLHYERSPMYHAVLLTRLLDCYMVSKDDVEYNNVNQVLYQKLAKGFGRLSWFTVNNLVPEFNDATNEETPDLQSLFKIASDFGIKFEEVPASDSGFYKLQSDEMTLFADFGNIQPSYQPGHAHAGALAFVLFYQQKPLIVDTGISTYNIGTRRNAERSTLAHNTITYGSLNSSEVWGGFRVGRRAHVKNIEIKENVMSASHNGYRFVNAHHHRTIEAIDEGIVVSDLIKEQKNLDKMSQLHFHPDTFIQQVEDGLILNNSLHFTWEGVLSWKVIEYDYALGYNKLTKAKVWQAQVTKESKLIIKKVNR